MLHKWDLGSALATPISERLDLRGIQLRDGGGGESEVPVNEIC